jgi:hypothetical protein
MAFPSSKLLNLWLEKEEADHDGKRGRRFEFPIPVQRRFLPNF